MNLMIQKVSFKMQVKHVHAGSTNRLGNLIKKRIFFIFIYGGGQDSSGAEDRLAYAGGFKSMKYSLFIITINKIGPFLLPSAIIVKSQSHRKGH